MCVLYVLLQTLDLYPFFFNFVGFKVGCVFEPDDRLLMLRADLMIPAHEYYIATAIHNGNPKRPLYKHLYIFIQFFILLRVLSSSSENLYNPIVIHLPLYLNLFILLRLRLPLLPLLTTLILFHIVSSIITRL